jgi:AcrR family transcriptional regulator
MRKGDNHGRLNKRASRTPQRRLSSAEAREAIFAATEKRLLALGPDGLRLQEIAKDVGLSHPTVLHHVGSREELVAAVSARAMRALEEDLLSCFTGTFSPAELAPTLHKVDAVMRLGGQARLLAWLTLTKPAGSERNDTRMGDVAAALDALRAGLGKEAPFEDTAFIILLVSATMFGVSLVGPGLLSMMNLPHDEGILRRFREWLTELLLGHVGIPVSPKKKAAVAGRPPATKRRK